jgi:tetratricopeptide (TPR) repeat protein
MDKPIEVLLSEISNDVAELKSKLDDQGASKRPQESDEWNRLSARWNFTQGTLVVFTIVFTILTVLFTGIGAFTTVNLWDLQKTVRDTESRFREVQKQAELAATRADQVTQAVQSYPEMLGDVAQDDVLISEGNRQYEAKNYLQAQESADKAIANLSSVLLRTGLSINELVDAQPFRVQACAIDSGKSAFVHDSCVSSDQLSGTEKLRPAICEALFAAEDFRLKVIFAAATKKEEVVPLVRGSARTLIALFGGRPEGYHWMGLVDEEEGQNEHATKCFDESLHQTQGEINKDSVNLAELEFVSKDYASSYLNARSYIDKLTQSGTDPYSSPLGIIAEFYLSLADFMRREDSSGPADFRKRMASLKGNAVFDDRQRSFSSTVLENYLKDSDSPLIKLDDHKRTEITITANCFLGNNDECSK